VLDRVVGLEVGRALGPEDGGAQLGDGLVVGAQALDHRVQRHAGVGQVVDQQHLAGDLALRRGDVVGDVQVALHRAFLGAVRAGGHDGQRHVEDAREHVARTRMPPRARHRMVSKRQPDWCTLIASFSIRSWYSS
jgi:hypothetical protein